MAKNKVKIGTRFFRDGYPFTVTGLDKRTSKDVYGKSVTFTAVTARGRAGIVETDISDVLKGIKK